MISDAANSSTSAPAQRPSNRWQRELQMMFERPVVELSIGGLIVISVALTILELSLPEEYRLKAILYEVNYAITCVFALELSLRFYAAPSKLLFFREFWIDILAVLPLLRVLRFARILRLLRLLRILRLIGIFSRYASLFPYIFRRGAVEYIIVSGLILLTIVFCTGAVLALESGNEALDTFPEAMWYSIYTLLAGEPTVPSTTHTLGGHLIEIGVMFMGMTVFAMFTGTVSAFMVERLTKEGRSVQWEHFEGHTIICGWNRKAEIIVREYRVARSDNKMPLVVIHEFEEDPDFLDPTLKSRVQFLDEDFTKVSALKKAGIDRAETCIILSDMGGGRSEQDADARAILAALTVEKLNPSVYTCAELQNREYGSHLEMGQVNDYIVSGENSGFLMAQAALNRGLMRVFTELLTHERGNQFYRLTISPAWEGKSFLDLFVFLKSEHNAILVAVHDGDRQYLVNPSDHEFKSDDSVIVICTCEIKL